MRIGRLGVYKVRWGTYPASVWKKLKPHFMRGACGCYLFDILSLNITWFSDECLEPIKEEERRGRR